MAEKRVTLYCVAGRHKFTVTDPYEDVIKAGRSKVKMRVYKAPCPRHRIWAYKIIGKAKK